MSTQGTLQAEKGASICEIGNVTNIDSGSYTTILTYTVSTGKSFYISDMSSSATKDGIFRMKVDGYVVCTAYYAARNCLNCAKQTPDRVNSTSVIILEYKPDTDGADASANLGGYEI